MLLGTIKDGGQLSKIEHLVTNLILSSLNASGLNLLLLGLTAHNFTWLLRSRHGARTLIVSDNLKFRLLYQLLLQGRLLINE